LFHHRFSVARMGSLGVNVPHVEVCLIHHWREVTKNFGANINKKDYAKFDKIVFKKRLKNRIVVQFEYVNTDK
jgi:hypothetical protein